MIREEAPADIPAIRGILEVAFPQPHEAELVDRLRANGDGVISLVACLGGEVIGHILFSRLSAPFAALALGPVAVAPTRQGQGLGAALIRDGLACAARGEWRGVFVLGNPAYYRRFGFDPLLARGFACRYAGPNWMALALNGALPVREGEIEYAPAFAALV